MKIIDNRKDYYDWLVGVWGIDENLVFDRRKGALASKGSWDRSIKLLEGDKNLVYHFWIGDEYRVAYFSRQENDWVFGSDVVLNIKTRYTQYERRMSRPKRNFPEAVIEVMVDTATQYKWMRPGCTVFNGADCILGEFKVLTRFLTAEDAWRWVSDCLSRRKDKEIVDDRNDIQKLESAGFDKRTSFRNVK